jgi:hypothetical protein
MEIPFKSDKKSVSQLIQLWNNSIPLRTRFPPEDTIRLMEHELTPLLLELDNSLTEGAGVVSTAKKCLQIKKLIYESLWEHFGVTVYHSDDRYIWIDVKPSGGLANYITNKIREDGFETDMYFNSGVEYEVEWYKISVSFATTRVHEPNILIGIIDKAITDYRNMSASIIQRPTIIKRQNKAATMIQAAFKGWRTRRDTTWNIYHPYGEKVLNNMITSWSMEQMV